MNVYNMIVLRKPILPKYVGDLSENKFKVYTTAGALYFFFENMRHNTSFAKEDFSYITSHTARHPVLEILSELRQLYVFDLSEQEAGLNKEMYNLSRLHKNVPIIVKIHADVGVEHYSVGTTDVIFIGRISLPLLKRIWRMVESGIIEWWDKYLLPITPPDEKLPATAALMSGNILYLFIYLYQ